MKYGLSKTDGLHGKGQHSVFSRLLAQAARQQIRRTENYYSFCHLQELDTVCGELVIENLRQKKEAIEHEIVEDRKKRAGVSDAAKLTMAPFDPAKLVQKMRQSTFDTRRSRLTVTSIAAEVWILPTSRFTQAEQSGFFKYIREDVDQIQAGVVLKRAKRELDWNLLKYSIIEDALQKLELELGFGEGIKYPPPIRPLTQ